MPRQKAIDSDSRARIFRAAAAEFAVRGYAAANMDRVARAARLNKAMIYYHFKSKAALYRAILNDMFDAVRRRVVEVAASEAPASEKIAAYVQAIATEAEARPHFPPMWLREIAEGGEHIDQATIGHVGSVLVALRAIIAEGVRTQGFTSVHPLILQGTIIAPLMFFFATARVREKLARGGAVDAVTVPLDAVIARIQQLALAQLEGKLT